MQPQAPSWQPQAPRILGGRGVIPKMTATGAELAATGAQDIGGRDVIPKIAATGAELAATGA